MAALYSSVGHGGASGYLALMALLAVPTQQAATTALVLNVVVAGIAAWFFARAGHLRVSLLWPLIAVSVPCAFLGGMLDLPDLLVKRSLAAVLAYAAIMLPAKRGPDPGGGLRPVRWPPLIATGAGVGIVSGITGIGGGIFLSPLLVLARWATVRQAAAVASIFIVANSVAGLAGRAAKSSLAIGPYWPLLGAAVLGGIVGSRFGAKVAPLYVLRILLAAVMLAAIVKLILP